MKRNFKSLAKYLILISITALVTTVFFKLSKLFDNNNDDANVRSEMAVASKLLYSNRTTLKIDWHDWEFISMEKLRSGKFILTFNNIFIHVFVCIDITKIYHRIKCHYVLLPNWIFI